MERTEFVLEEGKKDISGGPNSMIKGTEENLRYYLYGLFSTIICYVLKICVYDYFKVTQNILESISHW